jgi:hypothetical protein
MKKILTAATSALMFLFVGSGAIAQDEETEYPSATPVEAFACSYRDGKGPDDLKAVVAEWNDWMDEQGATDYFAAVITPMFYGEWSFDLGWLGAWSDGNAMGAGLQNWITNGSEMGGKFYDVMECNSHTMFATMQVKEPTENDDEDDNKFVLAFSNCSINEGRTFEEYMAAQKEWNAYAGEHGFDNGGWVMWPIWGENVEADYDFKFLSSAPDYNTLGANYQLMADGHWQKSQEIFEGLLDCDSARIYSATVVREMVDD